VESKRKRAARAVGNLTKSLQSNYRDLMFYAVLGVLAYFINVALYFVLYRVAGQPYLIANLLAWLGSVLFSYVTTRKYIFSSHRKKWHHVLGEMGLFIFFRLISISIESLMLLLSSFLLGTSDMLVKLIVTGIALGINALFNRQFVFRKKGSKAPALFPF
jgi:putative flippase GtrA